MKQTENFATRDGAEPEIMDMQAYLNRTGGKMPLPLLYLEENGGQVTTEFLPKKKDRLVGILLDENTVVYLKALTKDVIKALYDGNAANSITEKNVTAWVKNHFTDLPNARAATAQDIALLDRKRLAFFITLECLDYYSVSTPTPLRTHMGWLEKGADCIKHWDGGSKIWYYLEYYGDLLVFSDHTENELILQAIRHDYFNP